MVRQSKYVRLVRYIVLLFTVIFSLFPIIWILMMSFQNQKDIISVPPKLLFIPTLTNYVDILMPQVFNAVAQASFPFVRALINTIIIAFGSVLISLFLGIPAAYALTRMKFPGKENIAFTLISFYFAPIFAIALPLYIIFQWLHLYDTYIGLMIAYQVITLPLIVWLLRSYFREVPREIEEASWVDGAGLLRTLVKVDLPILWPGLAASAVLALLFAWNNFAIGLILSGPNTETLTMSTLSYMGYGQVLWGPLAASMVLSMAPELIISVWLQRFLIRGLSFGAVK
ncbi:carbohydrate ABC transporter permease [Alicyclobacillaceae bacterium I2511]|nr:carbohydrate ABC transporter permease [Alicyclobacillaceae bacterium I2511]